MGTYNEAEQEILKKYAEQMYRVFIAADEDLVGSTCACCLDKRALAAAIDTELEKVTK